MEPEDKDLAAFPFSNSGKEKSTLTITVVGASGDLAKKKIFPALFALFYEGHLPEVLYLILYRCLLFYIT